MDDKKESVVHIIQCYGCKRIVGDTRGKWVELQDSISLTHVVGVKVSSDLRVNGCNTSVEFYCANCNLGLGRILKSSSDQSYDFLRNLYTFELPNYEIYTVPLPTSRVIDSSSPLISQEFQEEMDKVKRVIMVLNDRVSLLESTLNGTSN